MYGHILILLLGLSSMLSHAQSQTLDSLEHQLYIHMARDTVRVNLLNKIASTVFMNDPNKASRYGLEALEISEELKYTKGLAEGNQNIGLSYYVTSEYDEAIKHYEIAKTHFDALQMPAQVANVRNNMAATYYKQGHNDKAIDQYRQALSVFVALNNKKRIAWVYTNLGYLYRTQGDNSRALEYAQKSVRTREEIGDLEGVANVAILIGSIYEDLEDGPLALEYYTKAKEICEEYQNNRGLSTALINIGLVYSTQKDYSEAIEYLERAIEIDESTGDKNGISIAHNNLGSIYLKQQKYEMAIKHFEEAYGIALATGIPKIEASTLQGIGQTHFEQNRFDMAYTFGKRAYKIALEAGSVEEQRLSARLVAESSEALGRYKEAYEYHIIFKRMNDSLFNAGNIKKITGLEYQYNYEKEKQQTELEQQKLDAVRDERERRLRALRNSFISGFVLVSLLVLVVYRNFLQKRKANVQLAQQKDTIKVQADTLEVTNKELAESNATKDKFFSIVAHDMKDPFNALLGMSNLLLNNYNDFDEKTRQDFVKNINDSSAKTYKMVNNLLTWSRSQLGQIKFTPSLFYLNELADEIIDLVAPTVKQKEISVNKEIDKNITVVADRNMLEVVLRNLISNAIKFTPRGGDVMIKALSVADDQGEFLQVIIEDNGVGIEKENQSRLFGLDTNISTTGTENETGTGLGLIICREFIQKHSGKIWLVSEKGKGSSFYFTIPIIVETDDANQSSTAQTG